ncbi:MAG TPA: adenylate/guanylate cyclase domain-containing protein [Gaiellaceae bacterium]|nr:adenylate/guanylate cyclase domain-containing protein [Gaiellaceae bacterium]
MSELPGGTVTFLFSDIEGSTRLLEQLGDRYQEIHREHRRILREQLNAAGGQEIDTQGDAFFFSFPRAKDAVVGAVAAQRELATVDWPEGVDVRVRMGLHTGEPTVGEEGYLGIDVVRAARICSAGHGGQVLLSETTRALVGNNLPEGVQVRDLGQAHLKDIQHERIFELALDDQPGSFPPLKTTAPKTAADDLAAQIERKVHEQILASFDDPVQVGKAGSKLAVFGLTTVFLLALMIIAIILLVKLAF